MEETNGPSGREWGNITREVTEIRHDLRNLKTTVDLLADVTRDLDARTRAANTRITTAVKVLAGMAGVLGFGITTWIALVTLGRNV